MTSYELIIFGSGILILSFLYSEIAKRTNIPSVLMLIATGIVIGYVWEIDTAKVTQPLELLGVIGLVMIVLEGALDLSLQKEKIGTILRATGSSFFGLLLIINLIALVFAQIFLMDWQIALLYATPLAIISSAIVIPSINNLREDNKEFLVYESCLSDILGIMFFNFIIENIRDQNFMGSLTNFSVSLVASIILGVGVTLGLVMLFKYVKGNVKLFLFIAILMVLYAVAKLLHLAPLLLILFFGIALKNHELFFGGRLRKYFTRMEMKGMERNFHIITRETAFVLRTYFFVLFGLSISIASLLNLRVLIISLLVIVLMYATRWVLLQFFKRKSAKTLLFMAPRGLITVLLFYSIPANMKSELFEDSVLLFVILISSFLMSYGLIQNQKKGWEIITDPDDLELEIIEPIVSTDEAQSEDERPIQEEEKIEEPEEENGLPDEEEEQE